MRSGRALERINFPLREKSVRSSEPAKRPPAGRIVSLRWSHYGNCGTTFPAPAGIQSDRELHLRAGRGGGVPPDLLAAAETAMGAQQLHRLPPLAAAQSFAESDVSKINALEQLPSSCADLS